MLPSFILIPELPLTIIIEAGAVALLARYIMPQLLGKLILASILINLISHPVFSWWFLSETSRHPGMWFKFFLIGEGAVIVAETFLYYIVMRKYKMPLNKCFQFSFFANSVSAGIGLLLPF